MAEALTSLDGIKAPAGTKLWIMHLGYLECDEAFLLRGVGSKLIIAAAIFIDFFRAVLEQSRILIHHINDANYL